MARDTILIENAIQAFAADLGYGDWIIVNGSVFGVGDLPQVVRVYDSGPVRRGEVDVTFDHASGSGTTRHTAEFSSSQRFTTLRFKLGT